MAIGPPGFEANRPDSSLVVENVSDPTGRDHRSGTGFPPETTEPPQPDCASDKSVWYQPKQQTLRSQEPSMASTFRGRDYHNR
jgi:hypothetical protein